jgi:sugar lactone lactonase YvrE
MGGRLTNSNTSVISLAACALVIMGCREPHPGLADLGSTIPQPSGPSLPDTTVTPGDTDVTDDTDDSTSTGTDDTGEPPPTDLCANLPPNPTSWQTLGFVPTSEDFAFDNEGYLVNVSDALDTLAQTSYAGVVNFIAPYSSWELAGITMLLDGDAALCDEGAGSLVRLTMAGGQDVILGGMSSPNSVTIDEEGFIYSTAYDEVRRINPTTGDYTILFELQGKDLDGLTFSPDFDVLYFNHDEGGEVGSIEVDATGHGSNLQIITDLGAGWSAELNGATVDECGNLYVTTTNGEIHRIFPDGSKELFIEFSGSPNTTALNFGSGIGGWKADHLYVMNRYGDMYEVDVGLKGKWEPHMPMTP